MARVAGRPVFVPYTAPGDVVLAHVPPGEGAAHATLEEVLQAGPDRIAAPCPHFGPGAGEDQLCGGCEWLHLRYEFQLQAKERGLVEALRRIGRLPPGSYPIRPIARSPLPLRYRSRAKFHLDPGSGRLVFFRRRSHEPVRLRECHLLEPGLDGLREEIGPALARSRLRPSEVALEWSERERRGAALLRNVEIGEAARGRVAELISAVPSLAGVVLEGEGDGRRGRGLVLVGDPVLRHDRVPGAPEAGLYRSRPDVFQQANRAANVGLVREATDMLVPDGVDVLELFCGAGNFTGALAARAASVSAVEMQGPALELARSDLGGRNVRFYAGDSLAIASALAREGKRFAAVLLDPPREGMKGLGPLLRDLGVQRAVYVSCDPATLARDLRGVVDAGYRIASVLPVDMFPQTHHVEALVLLERA